MFAILGGWGRIPNAADNIRWTHALRFITGNVYVSY